MWVLLKDNIVRSQELNRFAYFFFTFRLALGAVNVSIKVKLTFISISKGKARAAFVPLFLRAQIDDIVQISETLFNSRLLFVLLKLICKFQSHWTWLVFPHLILVDVYLLTFRRRLASEDFASAKLEHIGCLRLLVGLIDWRVTCFLGEGVEVKHDPIK